MMMRRRCMYILLLLLLQYYNQAAAAAAASTSDNITTVTTTTTTTKHLSPDMQQKVALYEFKLSFSINTSSQGCDTYFSNGSSSWHPMNWSMNSDYCKWEGVTCNEMTGDVIGLDLSCSHLVGSISPNSTLFQLSHLQVITIIQTDISGVIPEEIFHLPNLKELRINPASNNVNVSVILPKLKWGSSNTLQILTIVDINIIGGVLPDSIGYLNSLTSLSLEDCNLSGPIPISVTNLTQLTELRLYGNQLSGQIPDSVANLKKLERLGLSYNQLSSRIPDSLANLKKLEYLALHGNNLKGEFPSWVANLTQLSELYLDDNSLTGSLPSYLPPHSLLQLNYLFLSNNSLSGTLPSWLFQIPSLIQLYIDSNKFTGQLPYKFNSSSSSSLQIFLCSNNLLNGTIPKSFSDQLLNLTQIDLSLNKFSGELGLETFSNLQHLESLDLSHNSLSLRNTSTTTLPPTLQFLGLASCKITKFPHLISSLENLTYLDLSNNQIDGNIPNWIGGLTRMNYLNLSHNSLTGGLEQLTWSSLQYLDLQSNMLNGSLYSSICNSTSLEILNLSHNNFSGVFPVCPGNLSYSLSVLDLRMNNITGSLPLALSKFQNLRSLNMHGNKLQGTIPPSFSEFDFLEVLDLGSNHINDVFPHCLEALPKLQVLILKSNKFHGIINNISQTEHPFPSLRIIDLSDNQFSGPLPTKYIDSFKGMMNKEVNKVPLGYMGDRYYSDSIVLVIKGSDMELVKILTVLTTIDLSRNSFNGEIPEYIGKLVSLRYLNLSHNHITGGIEQLPWSSLQYLDLQSNMLNGSLSSSIYNSTSLEILNLSHNNFSGVFPVCSPGNLSYSLSVLDLRMNKITGSLPLALSKFQNLRSLNMHGNKLQGSIPVSFSEFDFLEVLDVGSNHINDMFPHCLEALPKLQVLILKSNKFHGIINNISQTDDPFPSLRIIDLSDNQFLGPLPTKYIENFNGMMNKEVNKVPLGYMGNEHYSDSIALVIKGVEFELVKILTIFTTIDLSRNMFEGEIPAHIGNLVSLRYLNLSHNHLTGSIPSTIGDLSVLESLDFSSNQLVGEIPQQLTHIDSLAKLNLSQNDLNGRIPEAPHFTTFDDNSYSGNPGLCGFPLSKKCRVDNIEPHEEEEDDYFFNGFTWEAVVMGYGCGVVVGFVGGYIMFMAGKPK